MNARTRVLNILAAALATAGTAAAAPHAAIVDIDQAKVPFTISEPGSYRLTSDLHVTDVNTSSITVTASNVTIDLNGFTVTGGGIGIDAFEQSSITIYNGQVSGGGIGITVGADSRIERVRVSNNTADGIVCSGSCEIVHCVVSHNGFDGIRLADTTTDRGNGVVSSSVVQFNGSSGIVAGRSVLVTGNSIANNKVWGLVCLSPSGGYSNNVFNDNGLPPSGCVNLGQNACAATMCP